MLGKHRTKTGDETMTTVRVGKPVGTLVNNLWARGYRYRLTEGTDDVYINQRHLDAVVFIGAAEDVGNGESLIQWCGTGFFIGYPSRDADVESVYGYLVTCKHLIDGLDGHEIVVRLNKQDGTSTTKKLGDVRWYYHEDKTVDLAICPVSLPTPGYKVAYIDSARFVIDRKACVDGLAMEIGHGDEVSMVGLFANLHGKEQNQPLVRSGAIAMLPAEPIPTTQGPVRGVLVEVRSIGGLSGSPVFVLQQNNNTFRACLLGVAKCHWEVPMRGTLKGGENDVEFNMELRDGINMGLAVVIPASQILDVLEARELTTMRNELDEKLRESGPRTVNDSSQPSGGITRDGFMDALKKVTRKHDPEKPDQGSSETSE